MRKLASSKDEENRLLVRGPVDQRHRIVERAAGTATTDALLIVSTAIEPRSNACWPLTQVELIRPPTGRILILPGVRPPPHWKKGSEGAGLDASYPSMLRVILSYNVIISRTMAEEPNTCI